LRRKTATGETVSEDWRTAATEHLRRLCAQQTLLVGTEVWRIKRASRGSLHQSMFYEEYLSAKSVEGFLYETLGLDRGKFLAHALRTGAIRAIEWDHECTLTTPPLIPEMLYHTGSSGKLEAKSATARHVKRHIENLPNAVRRKVRAALEMAVGGSRATAHQILGLAYNMKFEINNHRAPASTRDGGYSAGHTLFADIQDEGGPSTSASAATKPTHRAGEATRPTPRASTAPKHTARMTIALPGAAKNPSSPPAAKASKTCPTGDDRLQSSSSHSSSSR
jgi:hypothetical protein